MLVVMFLMERNDDRHRLLTRNVASAKDLSCISICHGGRGYGDTWQRMREQLGVERRRGGDLVSHNLTDGISSEKESPEDEAEQDGGEGTDSGVYKQVEGSICLSLLLSFFSASFS